MIIQFLRNGQVATAIDLNEGERIIGSDNPSNILIEDPSVSPAHAKIFHKNGKAFIVDLGSICGTSVDDQQACAPIELRGSQCIRLGDLRFQMNTVSENPLPKNHPGKGTIAYEADGRRIQPQYPSCVMQTPTMLSPLVPGSSRTAFGRLRRRRTIAWAGLVSALVILFLIGIIWVHTKASDSEQVGTFGQSESVVNVQAVGVSPESIHSGFFPAIVPPKANADTNDSIWMPASKQYSASLFYWNGYIQGVNVRGLNNIGWAPPAQVNADKLTPKDIETSTEWQLSEAGKFDGMAGRSPSDRASLGLVVGIDACITAINTAVQDARPDAIPEDLAILTRLLGILLSHDSSLSGCLVESAGPDDVEFTSSTEKARLLSSRRKEMLAKVNKCLQNRFMDLRITCALRFDPNAIPYDIHSPAPAYLAPVKDTLVANGVVNLPYQTPLSYSTWETGEPVEWGAARQGADGGISSRDALFLTLKDDGCLPKDLLPLDPAIRQNRLRYANLAINRQKSAPGSQDMFGYMDRPYLYASDPLDRQNGGKDSESGKALMRVSLRGTTSGTVWLAGVAKEVAQKIKATSPLMVYETRLNPKIVIDIGFKDHQPGILTDFDKVAREYSEKQELSIGAYFCFDLTEVVRIGPCTINYPWPEIYPPGQRLIL